MYPLFAHPMSVLFAYTHNLCSSNPRRSLPFVPPHLAHPPSPAFTRLHLARAFTHLHYSTRQHCASGDRRACTAGESTPSRSPAPHLMAIKSIPRVIAMIKRGWRIRIRLCTRRGTPFSFFTDCNSLTSTSSHCNPLFPTALQGGGDVTLEAAEPFTFGKAGAKLSQPLIDLFLASCWEPRR